MSETGAPWLSIIIPTLNEAEALPRCVDCLTDNRHPDRWEIIVADGGSTDGTVQYAAGHPAVRLLPCTRGRARQMNAGAGIARAEHLWFLHADTLPPPDWFPQLRRAAKDGLPACFSLRFGGQERSRLLRFYARGSRIDHPWVRFGDQSLFVRMEDFVGAGGFREDHLLLEGHEMVSRLRRRCGGFLLLPAAVVTSARRYHHYGVVYTQAVFALLFGLYRLGVSQEILTTIYRRAFRPESS